MTSKSIIIFGGTSKARKLAVNIASEQENVKIYYSLAGEVETRPFEQTNIKTVIRKFGTFDKFLIFVENNNVSAVIDALHPFADIMREKICLFSSRANINFYSLRYPDYQPQNGEFWISIKDIDNIIDTLINYKISKPFFAVGAKQISQLLSQITKKYPNQNNFKPIIRTISNLDQEYENKEIYSKIKFITAKPNLSYKEELEIFTKLKPDAIIAKNSGLDVFVQKVKVAKELKIPLFAIENDKNIVDYSESEIINLLFE